jgi:hypothetical protein
MGQCLLIAEASWTHSVAHATLGKTPSGRVIGLSQRPRYLKIYNTHNSPISILPGFELVIPASERPKTHAWYQAATRIGDTELVEDIIEWILQKESVRRYSEINYFYICSVASLSRIP